jgi:hypothetical protein
MMLPSTTLTSRLLSPPKYPIHVAPCPRPPTRRFLLHRHSVNNHGDLSALYSRVPSNHPSFHSPPHSSSRARLSPSPHSSLFILRHVRLRPPLRFPPSAPSAPAPFTHTHAHTHILPASRMFVSTERLSSAWRHTPMKWNPLPWFVGALLLVLIQYRRHRLEKEVHVDEDGHEVIKLKGPWQVGNALSFFSGQFSSRYISLRAFIPSCVAPRHTRVPVAAVPVFSPSPPNARSTILIVP